MVVDRLLESLTSMSGQLAHSGKHTTDMLITGIRQCHGCSNFTRHFCFAPFGYQFVICIHSSEKSCFEQNKRMVPICLHCLNCMKFGQFIFRNVIKIAANRCLILTLKCTRFDFGWGSTPDPLAGFKGAYF